MNPIMPIRIINGINSEDLITQIQQYEALWNDQCEAYSNKITKKNAWEKVILFFVPDFHEKNLEEKNEIGAYVQKKWKSLRNSYARERAKKKKEKIGCAASGRRQYMYFDQLRFLDVCSTKKNSDSGSKNEDESIEPVAVDDGAANEVNEVHPPASLKSKTVKRKNNEDDELIDVLKKRIKGDSIHYEDEDKLFLLSLLPEIKKIPENMRLRTKSQLIDVIVKAQDTSTRISTLTATHSTSIYSESQQPEYLYSAAQNNPPFSTHMATQQPVPVVPRYEVSRFSSQQCVRCTGSTASINEPYPAIDSPVCSPTNSQFSDESLIGFDCKIEKEEN